MNKKDKSNYMRTDFGNVKATYPSPSLATGSFGKDGSKRRKTV